MSKHETQSGLAPWFVHRKFNCTAFAASSAHSVRTVVLSQAEAGSLYAGAEIETGRPVSS